MAHDSLLRKRSAFLILVAPTARFLVGFPSAKWQDVDGLSVQDVSTQKGFASLTLSSRDNKPIRDSSSLLLTAGSRVENRNMVGNEKRTSVGDQWGEGPTQVEGVTATIMLETNAKAETVYALDATGTRTKNVPTRLADGKIIFRINPEYQTVWYEVSTVKG
jgi:hypothetical protein